MKKISTLVIFITTLIGSSQLFAATEVWQADFNDEPAWQRLTLDIPGKDPRLLIDHGRDLLYVMQGGRKGSMQLTAYAL